MTQIPAGYDRYICIAKSFGTMVAAGWVKAHPEYHVTLLQLTPLAWEYAPLYAGMPAWHATGTADPLGGAALRRALEDDPAITTYFVEGGNHSLDTPEDYTIGLEALKDIVRKYEEAMRQVRREEFSFLIRNEKLGIGDKAGPGAWFKMHRALCLFLKE